MRFLLIVTVHMSVSSVVKLHCTGEFRRLDLRIRSNSVLGLPLVMPGQWSLLNLGRLQQWIDAGSHRHFSCNHHEGFT